MNEPYASFYEQARKRYAPTLLSYTPEEEGTLRARIEAFLRPPMKKPLPGRGRRPPPITGLWTPTPGAGAWAGAPM